MRRFKRSICCLFTVILVLCSFSEVYGKPQYAQAHEKKIHQMDKQEKKHHNKKKHRMDQKGKKHKHQDKKKEDIVTPKDLNKPTNITITPVGTSVKANTLNTTTLYMEVKADITAGQATGGRAELYVDSKLIALDTVINATDTTVNFTTSDSSPTNGELKALVPKGGVVSVVIYNSSNKSATSTDKNPTLIVDYEVPVISGITTAILSLSNKTLTIYTNGVTALKDKVDVTKISLYDQTLNKYYQLTNLSGSGSVGTVSTTYSMTIELGYIDVAGLYGYGSSTVLLSIAPGALLYDDAGNTSVANNSTQVITAIVLP